MLKFIEIFSILKDIFKSMNSILFAHVYFF